MTERPSVFLPTLPFSISSPVFQKQPFPDGLFRLLFRRKLLNVNLTSFLATRTSGTATTPVTGAIKLDLLTPSSCITPDIDLLPPRSCTLNRVPTLPLLAFCRNTKRYPFFTSPSVPYNPKHVFSLLEDDGSFFQWMKSGPPTMPRRGDIDSPSVTTLHC